jgi:lantibiotic biosynthesis protein
LNASNYWYDQTLKMGSRNDGLAGYKFLSQQGWANEYNLLEGVSGIGLSLLSFLDPSFSWDECLLIS